MATPEELMANLEEHVGEVARDNPAVKNAVALKALRQAFEILDNPKGLVRLLEENKVVFSSTELGTTRDAEKASLELKTLLNVIKSACRMARINEPIISRG